jgi:autotransporter-associated beta strand protein
MKKALVVLFIALTVLNVSHGRAEDDVLVGHTAGGRIKARAEFPPPFLLPASIYQGISGFASGDLGFHSAYDVTQDDPAGDFYHFSAPYNSNFEFILLANDPGMDVWNDHGSGFMSPGQTFFIGLAPFDTHPVWNIPDISETGTLSLTLKFHDTSGIFQDSDPLVLSFTPTSVNGQWATNGSGTWSGTANWSGGDVPGLPQSSAAFGAVLTSGTATVTLDRAVSLASLAFSASGGAGYVISPSGTNTLTLTNAAGSATIINSGGNHMIAAPMALGSNLSISTTAGSALTISGPISDSGGGRSLSLSGKGELILSGSNTFGGGTDVMAGTLVVSSRAALPDGSSLSVGKVGAFAPLAPLPAEPVTPVPEPGTLGLLVTFAGGATVYQRRRARRKKQYRHKKK